MNFSQDYDINIMWKTWKRCLYVCQWDVALYCIIESNVLPIWTHLFNVKLPIKINFLAFKLTDKLHFKRAKPNLNCPLFSHTHTHSCLTVFPSVMGQIKAPPPHLWPCVYLPTAAPGKPKLSNTATLKPSAVSSYCIIQLCTGTRAKTTPAKTSLIHVHPFGKSFEHESKQSRRQHG